LRLGAQFAVFLCDFAPAASLVYLPDVARLEWAYHEVFHARQSAPIDTTQFAAMTVEEISILRFTLPASSQLIHSPYPVLRIWQVNQPGFDGSQRVDLDAGANTVLLVRPELQVSLHRIEAAEARFLQSLVNGQNLADATCAALQESPEFDLEDTLGRFIAAGALSPVGAGTDAREPDQ
jgi:hypothetical protein